jgi:hypothetical protein
MSTILGTPPASDIPNVGDSWRTIGKHPLLELKHTVEDRLLVATHISFLGLRAMLHRNGDQTVLFSDTIDEPKTQGNAVGGGPLSRPPDRILVLTDRHLYVVSSPSTAIFAPSSSGSCYPLSEFSRMAVISNASAAVIQFVGGIVAARFSSKRDCDRCATAVYTATGVATETLTAEELEQLHQRRGFGNSAKLSRFVSQTVRDAYETSSAAGGSDAGTASTSAAHQHKRRILRNDNGSVTNTVDNMLRFVLDGESELGVYDAGFPDAGVQATCDTDDMCVQAKPDMKDASTSPMDISLSRLGGSVTTRSYARRLEAAADESDEENVGDNLWSSLRGNPSQRRAAQEAVSGAGRGGSGGGANATFSGITRVGSANFNSSNNDSFSFANQSMVRAGSESPKMTGLNDSGMRGGAGSSASVGGGAALEQWLGVLASYRPAMEQLGVTAPKHLMRIPPGPEWESFLDACGINRAGHRVLLTTKVNSSRK